jgi:hypothetical protein
VARERVGSVRLAAVHMKLDGKSKNSICVETRSDQWMCLEPVMRWAIKIKNQKLKYNI